MKTTTSILTLVALSFISLISAQETEDTNAIKMDKSSYYEMRAKEDAKYEQELKAETQAEEESFWEDQKNYEKELKHRDRAAYRAYMRGKRDAYAEHYGHCDHHCHHSDWYYHHATFYYYGYHDHYYYHRYRRSNGASARVRVGTPNVRLSLF